MSNSSSADDAASLSAKMRSEVPGRGKEAQKAGEEWASQAGAKIDKTVSKEHL